tara:strand:- start:1654 stop:1803 length:150 start_codon:yes stop_codon:yes gene_type:complete
VQIQFAMNTYLSPHNQTCSAQPTWQPELGRLLQGILADIFEACREFADD